MAQITLEFLAAQLQQILDEARALRQDMMAARIRLAAILQQLDRRML